MNSTLRRVALGRPVSTLLIAAREPETEIADEREVA
jgi:hypothetical protein